MDYDGNTYEVVKIGEQHWMQENLKSLHYADGSPISNALSYNNDDSLADIYGRLYDWDAAMNYSVVEQAQGVCPNGWHIPSDDEWSQLADYLGGSSVAGGKMKQVGLEHWKAPNTAATNESGFNALASGEYDDTHFQLLNEYFVAWSSTQSNANFAKYRYLSYDDGAMHPYSYYKSFLYSVRCVKDQSLGIDKTTSLGLKVYPNPVDYLMYLDQEKDDKIEKSVQVFNQQGKEMMHFMWSGKQHAEDMGVLEPGIYLLKIVNKGEVKYKKILKR